MVLISNYADLSETDIARLKFIIQIQENVFIGGNRAEASVSSWEGKVGLNFFGMAHRYSLT